MNSLIFTYYHHIHQGISKPWPSDFHPGSTDFGADQSSWDGKVGTWDTGDDLSHCGVEPLLGSDEESY